jgi:hypothetical protein
MPRKATGSLIWRPAVSGGGSHYGRYWAGHGADRKQLFVNLHTEDADLARRRLGDLVKSANGARAEDVTEQAAIYSQVSRLAASEMARESSDDELRSARMVLLRAASAAAHKGQATKARQLVAAFLALGDGDGT